MNRLTRLTALLLAMLMIFSTVATAETAYQAGEMTLEQWNALVENVDAIVGMPSIEEGGVAVRPEIPDQPIIGDAPDGKQYLVTTAADISQKSADATLYTSGQLVLTGAADDQWQISVGGVWVNITGEMGVILNVTNAMVQELGATVQVRQANAPEKIANITVMEYAATMMMVAAVRAAQPAAEEETTPVAADDVMTIEEANQYLATINYVFEGDKPAASSYSAALGRGTPFNHSQPNPGVQGYKVNRVEISDPTAASYDQANNAVKFNIASVQNNVVVKVVYEPAEVDYTIIHYYQNTVGNGYTQNPVNTVKKGLTGSQVPETDIAEPPTGFYSLLYDRPTIAADGSTVVEIYYDRYYYLLSFELDGGYGVEPVYARYGSDLPEIGTPIRAGYTFKGWATTKALADAGTVDVEKLPTTMPEKHTTYYAVWEVEELAKVSVVIWGENANDEDYAYQKTIEIYAKPGSTISFTTGNTVCGYEQHTHNADCYDCGVTVHTHGPDCCTIEAHTHSEECCTIEVHTHSLDCYGDDVGERNSGRPTGAPRNPSQGQVFQRSAYYSKYVYLDGAWYVYTGSLSSGDTLTRSCGKTEGSHADHTCVYCDKTEHTHDGTNCVYCSQNLEEHTHTEECFSCTLTEHTHTSSCYITNPNMPSNLWELKTSDTVTVAADGSTVMNVYYDRTEKTLTFKNGNNTEYTLTKKWGADISEYWPIGKEGVSETNSGRVYDDGERWDPSGSSEYSEVLVFLEIMPDHSFTLSVSDVNYDTFIMHYMVEALASETTGVTTYTYNGTTKRFTEAFKVEANYNYVTKAEDFFDVEGFTQWTSNPRFNGNSLDIDGGGDVYFYYTRNSYTLSFNDGYDVVKTETVLYGDSWAQFEDYVPELPEQYEAGSREFAGWYWNPQGTSDEIVLSEETMPAENVIIYAKWTPKEYTVNFYLTEADKEAGKIYDPDDQVDDITGAPIMVIREASFPNVPHGTLIDQEYVANNLDRDAMNKANPRDPYKFVVWYYMDENNQKQVFTPNMQIKRNLDLIAEWTSDVLIPYTIKYMIKDTNTEIADPIVGSKLAGEQETFEAKGDTELYADYQTGYFPETNSHTITFEISDDGEVTAKEFIFWYTKVDAVPYKVYYKIVDENGNILGPAIKNDNGTEFIKEVNDNEKAVVTENFVVVPGYMPDAYQKRLVVTPGGENVITFYYTEDDEHAYYQVTHYTENIDKTWTEHTSSQIQGDIGVNATTQYSDDPLTIAGFTYIKTEYVYDTGNGMPQTAEGSPDGKHTLDEYGLQINIYYTRNSYPYVVNYYLENSNTKLIPSKEGENVKGLYGETIPESAVPIPGYDALDPTTQQLTIRIEETVNLNVINFYYREKVATINYVPMTSDGNTVSKSSDGGTVSLGSETIGVVTGDPTGSTPTAKDNYTFKGWFTDEACTILVASDLVDKNGKITPQKTKDYDADEGTVLGYESATYYALFEENKTTITYIPVGPDNQVLTEAEWATIGNVDPHAEQVNIVTGTANGSTASPSSNVYKFVGWYSDADCTVKVGNEVTFVPTKEENAIWDATNTTYYAKFEYNLTSLTIQKSGVEIKLDPNTSFVFNISGNGVDLDVVIHGNGTATIDGLTVGETYTITEKSGSWRYVPDQKTKTITLKPDASSNTVVFNNTREYEQWLDSEASHENVFGSQTN